MNKEIESIIKKFNSISSDYFIYLNEDTEPIRIVLVNKPKLSKEPISRFLDFEASELKNSKEDIIKTFHKECIIDLKGLEHDVEMTRQYKEIYDTILLSTRENSLDNLLN